MAKTKPVAASCSRQSSTSAIVGDIPHHSWCGRGAFGFTSPSDLTSNRPQSDICQPRWYQSGTNQDQN